MDEPLSRAIGKCLRTMDSTELGAFIAGALALRRVLIAHCKTTTNLAGWIECWASFEIEVAANYAEAAEYLFFEAMDKAARVDGPSLVGTDVGLGETKPDAVDDVADKTPQNCAESEDDMSANLLEC